MGIKRGGDLEQRRQQVITPSPGLVVAAEVLYSARPVDIRQQAVVAQAHALEDFGRRNVENLFQRYAGPYLVQAAQQEYGSHRAGDKQNAEKDRDLARRLHFRFRCSNTSTAPHSAMVA